MPDQNDNKYPHFILEGYTDTEPFRRHPQDIDERPVPERNRIRHAAALTAQIQTLRPVMETARKAQEEAGLDGGFGLQVEFESFPDIELAFESLTRERSGIELFNVRHDD